MTRLLEKSQFADLFERWLARIRVVLEGDPRDIPGPGSRPVMSELDVATAVASDAIVLDTRERGLGASEQGAPDSRAASGKGGGSPQAAWALVGIKRRGAMLARRLWNELHTTVSPLPYGEVDISLYRDDYHIQTATPRVLGTEISFRVDGMYILLVDDVLYTGRTVRAAMDLISDFGRPRGIALAVFVDRGNRELPIAANFVGRAIPTARDDLVRVRLEELSEVDGVELIRVSGGDGENAAGNTSGVRESAPDDS